MGLNLEDISGIGKTTAQRMKLAGIDSVEKLASIKLQNLLKINGIGRSTAERYIDLAKELIEKNNSKERTKISEQKQITDKNVISDNKKISKNDIKFKQKQIFDKKIISNESKIFEKKVNLEKVNIPKKMVFPKKETIPKEIQIQKSKFYKKQKNTKRSPEKMKAKQKRAKVTFKTYFPAQMMQKIRFLHFKIKRLEKVLEKEDQDFSLEELNYIWDYVKLLNVNYKTQSQIKVFKELNITSTFYDPVEKKQIDIWDLMFECARVLWVLAGIYTKLSKEYETENDLESAIIAMVECSRAYKTAAYFSAACTRQEDKGISLSLETLELNSEESRIIAQSLAAVREENKKNFFLASKIYAGLSALSKRLFYLKKHDDIKNYQLKAQSNYDMGKAYHLKAKALLLSPKANKKEEKIKKLQQKANYYFYKAEENWEFMRNNFKKLSKEELENLEVNLSVVNENIIENDVEILEYNKIKEIQEIDPFIAIPENLAPFVPRTTLYLTNYSPHHLEFNTFKQFKHKSLERDFHFSKLKKLQNKKAGIGRVIKELKFLYENNDININMFSELLEKYSIELKMVESAIAKLKNVDNKAKDVEKKPSNITMSK
ncbi:MAG: helix-hairpin-helix domain-containing protein [Promethearchaeota archaeon]